MKKLIAIALLVASFFFAVPAFAQSCNGWVGGTWVGISARCADGKADVQRPDYRGYEYNGPNGYEGGYQPVVIVKRRKPHPGDICRGSRGEMYGLDKNRRWYLIEGSMPTDTSRYEHVTATCDEFTLDR